MGNEKTTAEFWIAKCYCEDEDMLTKINVPFGISSDEFFKDKPMCNTCGNHNLLPIEQKRPPKFKDMTQKPTIETIPKETTVPPLTSD